MNWNLGYILEIFLNFSVRKTPPKISIRLEFDPDQASQDQPKLSGTDRQSPVTPDSYVRAPPEPASDPHPQGKEYQSMYYLGIFLGCVSFWSGTTKSTPVPKNPVSMHGERNVFKKYELPREVKIGSQIWMVKNLDVRAFRNGDNIPEVHSDTEWIAFDKMKKAAWCYYDYDSTNGEAYGKLYNGYAVRDIRGIAPEGWRVAGDDDWQQLQDHLHSQPRRNNRLIDTLSQLGFHPLPAGACAANGSCYWKNTFGMWWTSTPPDKSEDVLMRLFNFSNQEIVRQTLYSGYGLSVRCIKIQ